MDSKQPSSDSQRASAFYLPGSKTPDGGPGRIEQSVTATLRDKSDLVFGPVSTEPMRAFYLPGMSVLSNVRSRLGRSLSNRSETYRTSPRGSEFNAPVRAFYLPATSRAEPRRR